MHRDLRQTLHRGAKLFMDSGEAASESDALATLRGYRMVVWVGPEIKQSAAHQAALLTIVNAGSRSLLGGVEVVGCPGAPLVVALPGGPGLREAVSFWGGKHTRDPDSSAPAVILGTVAQEKQLKASDIRVSFSGWNAGVAPIREGFRLNEESDFPPVGVLAGALAVSECFQHLRGKNPMAMRRQTGCSLWQPDRQKGWEEVVAPPIHSLGLPEKLWLVGLGHLGQSYLWTLFTLPYAQPSCVKLVLQDFDSLSSANLSTQLLTRTINIGEKKTRCMARLCEARGFETVLVERPFEASLRLNDQDPRLMLCGVDNPEARRHLEAPGFTEVIEAGLGHEGEEYLSFGLHGFPGPRKAESLWRSVDTHSVNALLDQPAYHQLRESGTDECGLIQIAGATVGVPFVGAFVSSLVIAEAVRTASGQHRYETMDGSLRNLTRVQAFERTSGSNSNIGHLKAYT